jgi:hypothetical protein
MSVDEDLKHKERMLRFCRERRAKAQKAREDQDRVVSDLIARMEAYIAEGSYERRGPMRSRYPVATGSRLLIEALDVIKKLTGKW